LIARAGLSSGEAAPLVDRLVGAGLAVSVGDLLVSPRVLVDLRDRLIAELKAHHAANPLSEGMPREEARERVFRRAAPAVFDAVVAELVSAKRMVARDRLALAGHQVSLSPDEERAQAALERIYREAKLTPPDLAAAVAAAGGVPAVVERVASLLLRNRTLVKIESLLFHSAALEELKADIRGLKTTGQPARVDVVSFKERYGVTRKYAIPLLEYLDRERVTRRVGDVRTVL
jgi:selenocysteine-specific elongation factor